MSLTKAAQEKSRKTTIRSRLHKGGEEEEHFSHPKNPELCNGVVGLKSSCGNQYSW
jgi:hypothetical protein